jgi:TonB family protein
VPWPKPIVEPPADPPNESQHNLALEQFPHPVANIFFPLPVPAAAPAGAVECRSHPAGAPPPSTLDPEPPSPSAFHLPHPKLGPLQVPIAGRIPADQIRIALFSGVAAVVFVAALMYTANRHSYSVMRAANQPIGTRALKAAVTSAPASPSVTAAPTTAATSPEAPSISTPAPASDSAIAPPPHATRRRRDDGYIAPPFSTPIPPELAVQSSTPRVPSASAVAASSPATLAFSQSNKADKLIETVASSAIRPRLLNVSSSEMAGNLLSARALRYPMLAKVAHLQGQVVVEAVVDRNGNVSSARVLSGHRLLRGAAVDEVLSRSYRPYLVDDHPVEVSTTITLDFPPGSTPSLPRQTATYVDLQAR